MTETPGAAGDRVKLVSAVPGRVRVRLPARRRAVDTMNKIAEGFAAAGVSDVETNLQTGSVLLRYDPATLSFAEVRETFLGLGLVVDLDRLAVRAGTAPSVRVALAAEQLNVRVGRATRGVDLTMVIPLGLGALSFRQLLRDTPKIRDAPWYILAWYAYDSFTKLNPAGRRATGSNEGRRGPE